MLLTTLLVFCLIQICARLNIIPFFMSALAYSRAECIGEYIIRRYSSFLKNGFLGIRHIRPPV